MKRKNGFTLMELLAVIVILAIIALIATPTILGVVEKAKKGASKASALAYIDAVEKYMMLHEMDSTKYPYNLESDKTYYVIPDSEIEIATISKSILPVVHAEEAQTPVGDIYLSDFIEVKGEAPVDGYVVIGNNKTVASATFVVNNYEVTCENSDKCEVIGKYDSNIIKATSVTISSEKSETFVGRTLQLTAIILPEDTTNKKVKWTSSDETIATVDENGLVTAVKKGNVTVTATTSNKKTATKNITISQAPVSFADDSWETIQAAVNSGTYPYQVGDTKTVGMGDFGTHTVRVANTSACTNGEISETACGFVVEFADIITTHVMNSTSTNVGGWPASEMRTYLNSTIYNNLPIDLQSVIADTIVVSSHGSTSEEANFTSTDKLYLLSTKEVWNGGTGHDTAESETRQLDYYANLGVTTSNYSGAIKQNSGTNAYCWLRSAPSHTIISFFDVDPSGYWTDTIANFALGVSPAFRIG